MVDSITRKDPAVDSNPDTSVPSTQEMIALMSSSLASQENDLTDDNLVAEDNGEHNDPDTNVAMEVSKERNIIMIIVTMSIPILCMYL